MLAKRNTLAPSIASDDPAVRSGEKNRVRSYETAYHARLLGESSLEEATSLIQPGSSPEKKAFREN